MAALLEVLPLSDLGARDVEVGAALHLPLKLRPEPLACVDLAETNENMIWITSEI